MKKRAFTLTELLVVVVIIGVLSAVVLPKFTKVLQTRKTTEAENIMAAVRNEQEARCMIGRNYTADTTKLAALPKATSKNYTYTLDAQGITATAKDGDYVLQIPSYTDGRICCSGDGCDGLNKDYPKCDSFTPDEATCKAPPPSCPEGGCEPEPEPCSVPAQTVETSTQTCGCNGDGTKTGTRTFDSESCSWSDWSWGACSKEETECGESVTCDNAEAKKAACDEWAENLGAEWNASACGCYTSCAVVAEVSWGNTEGYSTEHNIQMPLEDLGDGTFFFADDGTVQTLAEKQCRTFSCDPKTKPTERVCKPDGYDTECGKLKVSCKDGKWTQTNTCEPTSECSALDTCDTYNVGDICSDNDGCRDKCSGTSGCKLCYTKENDSYCAALSTDCDGQGIDMEACTTCVVDWDTPEEWQKGSCWENEPDHETTLGYVNFPAECQNLTADVEALRFYGSQAASLDPTEWSDAILTYGILSQQAGQTLQEDLEKCQAGATKETLTYVTPGAACGMCDASMNRYIGKIATDGYIPGFEEGYCSNNQGATVADCEEQEGMYRIVWGTCKCYQSACP